MNGLRRVLPALTVASAAALLFTWAGGRSQTPVPSSGTAATTPPPLPTGPAPDLNLVFTAQVIGWVEPCG